MINKIIFAGERASLKDSGGINIARYMFAAKICKNKKVLEVGCGSGYGTKFLAEHGAQKIVAYDADERAIRFAKRRFKSAKVEFVSKRIEQEKAHRKYDCVICFEVIEHLKEPELLLKFVKDSLLSRGKLFISTPNRLLSSYDGDRPSNPYHVREYTPKEYKTILKKFFRKVEVFGIFLKDQSQEIRVHDSWRWRLASKLVKKRKWRLIINYLPERPKRVFTGEVGLKFSPEDFLFKNKNVNKAPYMIAICEN